ncbi:hypothetical protein BpHYR1_007287 [Brachionus plicatilis]|uniref:Uncharacterized protein n=1 Tax=Brachionus plicatilis TaxID=10195 RepID=A0A3M7Q2Q5_BRAPC|nr:hypothetical protein BpHYR1_007287 [Brachionus plicatilis]
MVHGIEYVGIGLINFFVITPVLFNFPRFGRFNHCILKNFACLNIFTRTKLILEYIKINNQILINHFKVQSMKKMNTFLSFVLPASNRFYTTETIVVAIARVTTTFFIDSKIKINLLFEFLGKKCLNLEKFGLQSHGSNWSCRTCDQVFTKNVIILIAKLFLSFKICGEFMKIEINSNKL